MHADRQKELIMPKISNANPIASRRCDPWLPEAAHGVALPREGIYYCDVQETPGQLHTRLYAFTLPIPVAKSQAKPLPELFAV